MVTRNDLIEVARKRGIIYARQMTKEQLGRVISLNEKDSTVLCLPEVEKKLNDYRERHRERACEISRRWRKNNPEKAAANWARYKDLTIIGQWNWGAKKCDRLPGECWKTQSDSWPNPNKFSYPAG